MAIYRLSVSVISRSSGRSAVASAAYRSGEDIRNERDGRDHEYSQRSGVEHTEILAPDDAPDWALDRAALWNAVEAAEQRKDAQTAREVVLSLPHELDAEQRQELVRDFVQEQFVDRGMVADIAIHSPHREGDDRNHHAHVMLTTRTIDQDGFGQKDRSWNDKEALQEWREKWEQHLNQSLEKAGVEQRVDHRSLSEQNVEAKERAANETDPEQRAKWEAKAVETDRVPEPKLGAASEMERRGIQTMAGDAVREARELRDAVKERASEILERGRELANEMGEKLEKYFRELVAQRQEQRERQLAAELQKREQERRAERIREMRIERGPDLSR